MTENFTKSGVKHYDKTYSVRSEELRNPGDSAKDDLSANFILSNISSGKEINILDIGCGMCQTNMQGEKVTFKDAFDSVENYFKWRLTCVSEIIKLAKKYTPLSNKQVLDIGCGEGPLSYSLYKEKAEVHAIDIPNIFLERIKNFTKGMNINIIKASNEMLPYKDKFFDIIFSFDVMEHVRDYDKSFSEMNRCLKRKGYIFLEMSPYYSLVAGHHLYNFSFLPAQYLPKKFMKWWILRKKPNKRDTPVEAWKQFEYLNKISISKLRKLAKKYNLKILEENFIFKYPELFEININWIKYFGFLKEIIPMSYQAVLIKE
jgi:2-polyprenyl-3-methyl-5-hydroxy-6-metoxy-1,4-benzoquinol methylase